MREIYLIPRMLVVTFLLIASFLVTYSQTPADTNNFLLSIEDDDLSFCEADKIELKIFLTNKTKEDIYFVRGVDRDDFEIGVKVKNGDDVSFTKEASLRIKLPKSGSRYLVKLKPNETFSFAIELRDFYRLLKGKYIITISRMLLEKDKTTAFKAEMKPTEILIL